MAKLIGQFEHPKHGLYFIYFDGSCYGISKSAYFRKSNYSRIHCIAGE